MKITNILFASAAALFLATASFAQITMPRPSPEGRVFTQVGLTDVEMTYFRPTMKGRMIFGEGDDYLVPFGEVWRTGANSGTTISFSKDVTVEGQALEAGEYLILTIPGSDTWTLIFYGDPEIGGNVNEMKDEDVVAKVTMKSSKLTESVEALTFNIADISEDRKTAAIELQWANTSVKATINADYEEEVMANIEKYTQVNPRNYVAAANFYFNTGRDANQALEWIKKYFASDEDYQNQFWNLHLMAQIQQAAGDMDGAIATATKSLEKAKNNEGGDFGYIKRNEDLLAKLAGS